jgi:hypothetical protein
MQTRWGSRASPQERSGMLLLMCDLMSECVQNIVVFLISVTMQRCIILCLTCSLSRPADTESVMAARVPMTHRHKHTIGVRCLHLGLVPRYLGSRLPFSCEGDHFPQTPFV